MLVLTAIKAQKSRETGVSYLSTLVMENTKMEKRGSASQLTIKPPPSFPSPKKPRSSQSRRAKKANQSTNASPATNKPTRGEEPTTSLFAAPVNLAGPAVVVVVADVAGAGGPVGMLVATIAVVVAAAAVDMVLLPQPA